MSADDIRETADRATERNKTDQTGISRRKALGRMVAYTAPVMLALLASEAHACVSYCG